MNTTANMSFSQVKSLLMPQRGLLLLIAALVLAGAALEVVPPLIIQNVVDGHLTTGKGDGLLALGGAYLVVIAALQGLSFGSGYLTAIAAQNALRTLRVRLFAKLQRLPMRYFDMTPLGDIISRCTADVDTIDTLFSSGVANLLADLMRLIALAVTMFVLSPALTLIAALTVPPLLWFTSFIQRHVREAERANRRAFGALNTSLQETLGGAEVIRAFGKTGFFNVRFRAALQATLVAYQWSTRYSAIYTPLMVILSAFIVTALLWAGAQGALAGWGVTIGTLTAFVLLFRRFFAPITTLGEEWQTVQSALAGAERVFQVLALEERDKRQTADDRRNTGNVLIELKDVSFGYVDGVPALRHVSLQVCAGERVALVGRTGAGKSSIVHLIGGLYAPWFGEVHVAGADPCALSEEQRRGRLGVVPQMTQLFSGTLLENLTLGDSTLTREAVMHAARITGAHALIEALREKYDTQLSVAGAQFSAGQQQLLALTRALVRRPRILLLDEATAAIDNASDAAFRAALCADATAAEQAVLIVAHRLSTALEADRVIVLDDGCVIESGAPDELIRHGGHFAALLALEATGWDWRSR